MEPKETNQKTAKTASKKSDSFLKYSGMATQMAAPIVFFVFVGLKLDNWLETKVLFVLIGALLGVGLPMYSLIKQATNDNKS